MRRRLLFIAVMLLVAATFPEGTSAQAAPLCFPGIPGITNCIEGRFREYWVQNGGLPVFGYPISPATMQQTAEGTFLTQYFERNRFELHPENAPPYDVLLGRLGDDRLRQLGVNWQAQPREGGKLPACFWFEETGHNVCDLAEGPGFRSYWQSHGLVDRNLNPTNRSLALFGLPLTDARMETNASGDRVLTQWFERARFEYHPNNPEPFRVLLGLLGNEVSAGGSAPVSQPQPQPQPQPPVPSVQPPPQPTHTPTPPPVSSNCHPSYPTVCIPPPPPALGCDDIPYRDFPVLPPDPQGFDRNQNGVGCESEPSD